ncbi:unnamed protein product, partial [Ceratitis capitata]
TSTSSDWLIIFIHSQLLIATARHSHALISVCFRSRTFGWKAFGYTNSRRALAS